MDIIITGATSFIGSELSQWFIDQGDTVYGVCRSSSSRLKDSPVGVNPIYTDLANISDIVGMIDHADIFINLAWEGTGHGGRDAKDVQTDNVKHTLNAMEVAHMLGCKLFVESGSQAEYGTCTSLISEATACNPFSEYGIAKLEVWERGSALCRSMGMKYIHLRIFSTYGENDHPWTLVMSCVSKMLNNETVDLSSCEQTWNFLYVKDEVELIGRLCVNAVNDPAFGQEIYNIASATSKPLKEYVYRIKQLTGSASTLNFGALVPKNTVSLNADITKSYTAAGFTERYSFDQVIKRIINKLKKDDKSI